MNSDFIVFADSHIGTYEGSVVDESGLNGRLVDGLNVWDEVEQYAVSCGRKLVVFLGDRFRSNNPKGYIRDLADEKLKKFAGKFLFLCLVGNHDYYEKSSFYHSYGIAHLFQEELEGLKLLDSPQIYKHSPGLNFWALPHGRSMGEFDWKEFDELDFNVLIFHDDVMGAKYPSGMVVEKGLSVGELERFDLVLGGHIHLPQDISGCRGGFVGSVSQLRKDDVDSKRGWWDVSIRDGKVSVKVVESMAPKYIVETIELKEGDEWQVFFKDSEWKKKISGQYFILKCMGNKSILSVLDRRKIEQKLVKKCDLRFCTVEFDMQGTYEFKMPELKESKSVEEEIEIALNKLNLQGLKKEELRDVGREISGEVVIEEG